MGFSQHEGGERADWGSDKLADRRRHPSRSSTRRWARTRTTTARTLWLGRSAAQGVGCDDTVGPSRELRPEVVLIPTAKDAYLAAFPWLGYDGGWGEEHPQFYGGPTGPNTKSQWTEPITWANESWRDSAFAIPAGNSLGTSTTDFFCGAVAAGSTRPDEARRQPDGGAHHARPCCSCS